MKFNDSHLSVISEYLEENFKDLNIGIWKRSNLYCASGYDDYEFFIALNDCTFRIREREGEFYFYNIGFGDEKFLKRLIDLLQMLKKLKEDYKW